MATPTYSSHRSAAMALALVTAVVLSPLYVQHKSDTRYETRWSSGFILPMVLGMLIIAIRTASLSSSSSSSSHIGGHRAPLFPSMDSSFVLRIGSSSWGLAGILALLLLVLSLQDSVQEFFWR